MLCNAVLISLAFKFFYAMLPYIRHFIFAGCYDNNHWYLVTNLAGHLDLVGFYFSKCPAYSKCPAKFVTGRYIHLVMEEAQVYIYCICLGLNTRPP
jgi:hypothetical protein